MSRTPLSLHVDDVSALARSLRRQMDDLDRTPSHVEMLNLLAKAGGFKNFQHLKAQQEPVAAPAVDAVPEIDLKRIKKAAGYFDVQGRLITWPKKRSLRVLCLWVLWSRIPARTTLSELELDEQLSLDHLFCDHPLLRRWLVDLGLVSRTPDGREYKRIEAQPPAEALEVFKRL
ncbi:DUF2087 domain-containing protein [Pseudodesulfovibrio sp. zrk46]|uniref:DUF2087 domain-containing protein n=1 Tax=Pseudodesulfovibrio sp. zrk46 TaxID=2725288 RepID=UPI00144918F6|nr:DUF2087 domain-containing protein [Pseudodesulfovibrio sp. zrk46]QJB55571.1 DUF2087 domain-containing protein [Pseudodesulfovibrio sp. zrk46]